MTQVDAIIGDSGIDSVNGNNEWITRTQVAGDLFLGDYTVTADGSSILGVTNQAEKLYSVVKYDQNGVLVWETPLTFIDGINSSNGVRVSSIVVDDYGNIYAGGRTKLGPTGRSGKNDTDPFLVKLDQEGNILWVNNYGDTLDEIGVDIEIDLNGNLWINGRISNERGFISGGDYQGASFSGGWKGYQHVISPEGALLQTYTQGSGNSGGRLLALDNNLGIAVGGGYTFGAVNGTPTIGNGDPAGANHYLTGRNVSSGLIEWTLMRNWIRSNIAVDEENGFFWVINKEAQFEKIDTSTGVILDTFTVSGYENGGSIESAPGGGIWASTRPDGNKIFIEKISSNGESEFQAEISSTEAIKGGNIEIDPRGYLKVSGWSAGAISISSDTAQIPSSINPSGNLGFIASIKVEGLSPNIEVVTGLIDYNERSISTSRTGQSKIVIYGSDGFGLAPELDVNTIDIDSIVFGAEGIDADSLTGVGVSRKGNGAYRVKYKDVNKDGIEDLIVRAVSSDLAEAVGPGSQEVFGFATSLDGSIEYQFGRELPVESILESMTSQEILA